MIKSSSNNQEEIAQMLKDYLQNPHRFYEDTYEAARSAGVSRPGKELADLLNIAESSANRFARQRETDEAPTATGARSDLERIILTLKHFAIPHSIESAQTVVNALQQMIDDEIEHRADLLINTNSDHLKEIALRENSDVVVAIGANKASCEVLRESSEGQIATKLFLAVKRRQEAALKQKSA
jgi:hypothetical protein